MPASFSENLGRLRAVVNAGLPLPNDLGEWALAQVEATAYRAHLRCARDARLRTAAALIGGTIGDKVAAIEARARIIERTWNRGGQLAPVRGTIEGEILAARMLMDIPRKRQLYSILARQSTVQAPA